MQSDELMSAEPDEFCPPHRSTSFWAVTWITLLVPLVQYKHYGTLLGFVFPVSTAAAGWVGMFLARRTIAAMALQIKDAGPRELLNKISGYLMGLSVVVALVCSCARF